MKKFVIAIVAFLGLGAAVQAADVSHNMLSKMGLGGMQMMSDAQGMQIRGMGDQSIEVWGDVNNHSKINIGHNNGQINIAVVQNSNFDDIEQENKNNDVDVDVSKHVSKKKGGHKSKKHGRH